MSARWEEIIRKTGQLTVFPGKSLTRAWAKAFNDAINLINSLSLGVRMIPSTSPPTAAQGGANVQFEAITGTVTFSSFVGPVNITLPGNTLEGFTANVGRGRDQNNFEIGQAFSCVPSSPQMTTGTTGQQKQREAGDPVKLVLAFHELIHATGLSNKDHSKSPNPDVLFDPNSAGQGSPLDFDHPENDFLVLLGTGKIPPPRLPPIFLNPETSGKILALWALPRHIIQPPVIPRVLGF